MQHQPPADGSAAGSLQRDVQAFTDHMRVERGFSVHTSQAYQRDLEQYAGWLKTQGIESAAAVETALVLRYAHHLREPGRAETADGMAYAASTVARKLAAVRAWHKFLAREHGCADAAAGLEG